MKKFRLLLSSFLLCLFFLPHLVFSAPSSTVGSTIYFSLKDGGNLYSGPTFNSDKIEPLDLGAKLEVLEDGESWIKVKSTSNKEGYVAKNWISFNEERYKGLIEKQRLKRAVAIEKLEAEVKTIPGSDAYRNLSLYMKLHELDPENQRYKDKVVHYKGKTSQMFTFRKTRWGMSMDEVKRAEKGLNSTLLHDDVLGFKSTLNGMDVEIYYIFTDNMLTRSKYLFADKHTNKLDYISDYDSIEILLGKKYGGPEKTSTFWRNDLYKNKPQDWGMAVAVGHMTKYAKWKTLPTSIFSFIKGDNYKISVGIEYASTNLKSLTKAAEEKETLNSL